jgi:probable rRNA maturation factor
LPVLKKAALASLKRERLKVTGDINVIMISDPEIKALNSRFRKVRRITDIISFKYCDRPLSGDLYISQGRSQKQAKRVGHSWQAELCYLLIHGVLHLREYTDYVPREKAKMFKVQDAIFAALDIN